MQVVTFAMPRKLTKQEQSVISRYIALKRKIKDTRKQMCTWTKVMDTARAAYEKLARKDVYLAIKLEPLSAMRSKIKRKINRKQKNHP